MDGHFLQLARYRRALPGPSQIDRMRGKRARWRRRGPAGPKEGSRRRARYGPPSDRRCRPVLGRGQSAGVRVCLPRSAASLAGALRAPLKT